MIRLGKTLFHNRYFTTSSAEDFNDLKETLLFNIDHYEGEHGIFQELWGDFLEKKYENDIDNDESDEYTLVRLNSGMASVTDFLKFPIFRKIDVF